MPVSTSVCPASPSISHAATSCGGNGSGTETRWTPGATWTGAAVTLLLLVGEESPAVPGVVDQHLRGGEALAVLRLQRAQALDHVRGADRVHVPERPAAEGREA